jgi:hypothetical protein
LPFCCQQLRSELGQFSSVSPGRHDNDGMSQFSPSGTSLDRTASQRATWALFIFPALGCAVAAVSAFVVFSVAGFAGAFALGDSASPGQPAYDYVETHFPKSVFGFLTGYPLVMVACCVLVPAAAGLATTRRWSPEPRRRSSDGRCHGAAMPAR